MINENIGSSKIKYGKGLQVGAIGAIAPVQNGGAVVAPQFAPVCSSILDISVSGFARYKDTEPVTVNLLVWLNSDKYADRVNAIRATADKKERDRLKALLPCITPSGIFSNREAAGLIRHSGLIQFDIDGAQDVATTKEKVMAIENVAYCGLSVSGRGLWGLIPIENPEHHREYFTFIERAFASMGITIDPACKDVCRLRGYSYDPKAYFNHNAPPLVHWYQSWPKHQNWGDYHHHTKHTGYDTRGKVEYCINEVCKRGIDLTATYEHWFNLGCSLAGEFGEAGRDYFHLISQHHPEYDPALTDKQFTHCLRHRYGVTIASFFAACRDVGIRFRGIAPVQNIISENSHQNGFNKCNFPGGI